MDKEAVDSSSIPGKVDDFVWHATDSGSLEDHFTIGGSDVIVLHILVFLSFHVCDTLSPV